MKVNEIWEAIDSYKPDDICKQDWRRSYAGITLALQHVGLNLVTTAEEFEELDIPVSRKGERRYTFRKVVVSKNGVVSDPINIVDLLARKSNLLTPSERDVIYRGQGQKAREKQPIGTPTNNMIESTTIDQLDTMIDMRSMLAREHLVEFRSADIAYSLLTDDQHAASWVPDQIKTSRANQSGRCVFNRNGHIIKVEEMLAILNNNTSLTCIGKDKDDKIDVVWWFHGGEAITMLKPFRHDQRFAPRLHLKCTSYNAFTKAYNDKRFRYDVGTLQSECERLLYDKYQYVLISPKLTLAFLNGDDSQILNSSHRKEHQAYKIVYDACANIGVSVERRQEDAYTSIDFRVAGVRVQSKTAGKKKVEFRKPGRYPYNPNVIDIFQVHFPNSVVYAIPMRVPSENDVVSYYTGNQLMRFGMKISRPWISCHAKFRYDFNDLFDVKRYVTACKNAGKIGGLTDETWHANLIENNSERILSERKKINRNRSSCASG